MAFVVRVALAHHEMDLCSWVSCATDPPEKGERIKESIHVIQVGYFIPFVTINYNLIAFLPNGCPNIGGIRWCHFGKNTLRDILNKEEEKTKHAIFFRHGKSRANFAVEKRVKPLLLLRGWTVASQDLYNMHVVSNSWKDMTLHTHVTGIWRRAIHNLRSYVSGMGKDLSNDAVLWAEMDQLKALCTVPLPRRLTKERQIPGNEICLGKGSKDPAS
jgi:hypothetical protein